MKIQQNYITRIYGKPAFNASLSKDTETRQLFLSGFNIEDQYTPIYMYKVLKALENMNSKDTISLKRNCEEKACTITNDRTGKKVEFYMESPNVCEFGILGVSLPEAIFGHITENFQLLFRNTSYKNEKGHKFSYEGSSRYPDDYFENSENRGIEDKIRSLEAKDLEYRQKLDTVNKEMKELRKKIKTNNQEIRNLQRQQAYNGLVCILPLLYQQG